MVNQHDIVKKDHVPFNVAKQEIEEKSLSGNGFPKNDNGQRAWFDIPFETKEDDSKLKSAL